MLVHEAIFEDLVGQHLIEAAAVQIGALLAQYKLIDHLLGRTNPAEAESGRQRLGEGAEIDDVALHVSVAILAAFRLEVGVQRHQRRQMFALEPQRAVGVIFDQRDAVPIRQPHQIEPALQRQREPAGVLEIRQDVHELRADPQRTF